MSYLCLFIATFLVIWFRTEAFVEYTRMFRLNWLSKYRQYDAAKTNDVTLTYLGFLRQNYNCFFIRLITCPICFSMWIVLTLAVILQSFLIVPILFLGSLIIFGIVDRLV